MSGYSGFSVLQPFTTYIPVECRFLHHYLFGKHLVDSRLVLTAAKTSSLVLWLFLTRIHWCRDLQEPGSGRPVV